ncbi:geranylgeranylglycerol-phosphate geranylgeranyltransferase [soil metagenome]
MRRLIAFFKLIRWPNLVFIVITQVLFLFFIIQPVLLKNNSTGLRVNYFIPLCLASVLIAAAGYIINDYFDRNIDEINKPSKVIIDKIIKRRWAILLHLLLSGAGLMISLYVSLKTTPIIVIGNFACIILLWFYSTTFKKKLLVGNVIISALTAWVILVIYFSIDKGYSFYTLNGSVNIPIHKLFRFTILYSSFAFIISLIREVVKDIEDYEGDVKYNCTTMPVVWGFPVSKMFAAVWVIVLIGALVIIQFYVMQLGWWLSIIYALIFLIVPLLFALIKLYRANSSADFHSISNLIKMIMFAGILSMVFIKFYY